MNVAVIGGGIYGTTTALELDKRGVSVDLYEKNVDIMMAASLTNQWRLHKGYHYPRSKSTSKLCKQSASLFADRFPEAIITETDHYYCIAKERTKTTPDEFLAHCNELGLEYERLDSGLVCHDKIDLSVRVPENRIDPKALRKQVRDELIQSDVSVHLNTKIDDISSLSHDYIVVAAYSNTNKLVGNKTKFGQEYKHQVVEKPLVRLPTEFGKKSVVIMDGPFMCVDPYGKTGAFLLGNVVHAIHEETVAETPDFSNKYNQLLDCGLVSNPEITKFDDFVQSGIEFMPNLKDAKHIGSYYTIRTVLADVEDTDARPTIIGQDGNVFKLFSGKLASSVPSSREVASMILKDTKIAKDS